MLLMPDTVTLQTTVSQLKRLKWLTALKSFGLNTSKFIYRLLGTDWVMENNGYVLNLLHSPEIAEAIGDHKGVEIVASAPNAVTLLMLSNPSPWATEVTRKALTGTADYLLSVKSDYLRVVLIPGGQVDLFLLKTERATCLQIQQGHALSVIAPLTDGRIKRAVTMNDISPEKPPEQKEALNITMVTHDPTEQGAS